MRQQEIVLFGLGALAFLSMGSALSADNSEQVIATVDSSAGTVDEVASMWRVQRVNFEFRGDTVSYTCESFSKKVRAILIAVGVHPSLIIQARCAPSAQAPFMRAPDPGNLGRESDGLASSRGYRTTKLSSRISTVIALASPAIASKANIEEATTFNSERKLIARVNREDLPSATDVPIFPAVWVPITLVTDSTTWLDASDCELLRQLSKKVFPKVGVEVTSSKVMCSPSAVSKPTIEVRALLPLIRSKQPAGLAPPAP